MNKPRTGRVYLEKKGPDMYQVQRIVNRLTPEVGTYITAQSARNLIEGGTEVIVDGPKTDSARRRK